MGGEVTAISSNLAKSLVKGYANQYGHSELNKEVPRDVVRKVIDKAFKDVLTLAAGQDREKREAVQAKAFNWANKPTDVILGREIQQLDKLKAARRATNQIKTSREKGQEVLCFP